MHHHQGAMDGLCGVYSIINAMKVVRADKLTESKELFDAIIDNLSAKRNLRQIIKSGMTTGILYNLINDLIPREIVPRSRPFVGRDVNLNTVWAEMKNHLERPVNEVGVAIIALQGKYDHWTVVPKIEGETIFLADSSGLKRLNRKRITTGEPQTLRIHQIVPNDVIFIG